GPKISEDEIKAAFEKALQQYQPDGDEKLPAEDEKKLREGITEQLKVEKFIDELGEDVPKPSKQEIKEFYEEHKEDFKTPEQIKVSHIVKHINAAASEQDARQQIEQAHEELEKGETFELTARKYSDCTDNDGDLGHITKGQMVEEFEDVVFNMGVNEISPVFTTRFGFHIAKVYDRKPEGLLELDKVQEDISNYLMEQKKTEAMEKFVDGLKEKAEIKEA
ncbi:MAG: peptidylprolyl isomerase, partial [Planctomycetota bacterium]